MKAGTIIELPDGRRGTVVYNSLVGVGIKFGEYDLSKEDLEEIYAGDGNTTQSGKIFEWNPDALLRKPFSETDLECVGEDYKIIN